MLISRARFLFFSLIVVAQFVLTSCSGGGGGETKPVPIPAGSVRWSDPQTWGGAKPAAGQVATIPVGMVVALDEDPPELGGVEINGTLLVASRDTLLRTAWIKVNGTFQVGTENTPFTNRMKITLTGNPATDANGLGSGIWVSGGVLDLHGENRTPGWSRLAQTAAAGTSQLTLQDAPGWRTGDRIVIASTDFNPYQAEERTVTGLSGTTVQLDAPLTYTHWGATESGVEERAEVGLLSRNIIIQGLETSIQDGKGGHVIAMAGGTMRISGAEFTRMGRRGEVGRYPVHFHMMGDATGSYLKNSAVHHALNRCVSIHGSHNAVVQGNVAYDTYGHCYIFEDGIETGNLLENNLGLITRVPPAGSLILASDADPATFWITNPDNVLRGNAAAGSDRFAFWYALPLHPTGLSATDTVFPRYTPLREFSGNTAHSNGDGLFVDIRGAAGGAPLMPRTGGQPNGAPVAAFLDDFTGYKNRTQGIWIRGVNVIVRRAKLADNAIGLTFAFERDTVLDSIIVGESANKGNPSTGETIGLDGRSLPKPSEPSFPIRGFEFYDDLMGVENVSFVNFQPNAQRQAGALSDLRFDRFPMHPQSYARNAVFENANRVYLDPLGASPDRPDDEDGHRSTVIADLDGSVTGVMGNSIVPDNPFLCDSACTFRSDWNAYISPLNYGGFVLENREQNPTTVAPLRLIRQDGGAVQTLAGAQAQTRTEFLTNLLDQRGYRIEFGGPVPLRLSLQYRYRKGGDWIQLAVPYPNALFNVYRDGDFSTPLARVNSVAEVDAGTGTVYFHDTVSQTLHLKLMVRNDVPGRDSAQVDIVP